MSSPQFPAERVYDLLRYARHYLADEGMISQDELHALILAPSSSARRLETYDEMRQEIQGLRAAAAERSEEIAKLQATIHDQAHEIGELQGAATYLWGSLGNRRRETWAYLFPAVRRAIAAKATAESGGAR